MSTFTPQFFEDMDSLTQIVLGASVGEAVLGRKAGNHAILWGAIAGTIPDLDVLIKPFVSDIHQLAWHRGFSHSIVFFILLSPLLGRLIHSIYKGRRGTISDWSWFVWWVTFTHAILDCFTTWGTQLLWPHPIRIAWNNIFVADPLYTVPFLLCVLLLMFFKRTNPWRSRINLIGISMSSIYMVFTIISKLTVLNSVSTDLQMLPQPPLEISSKPTPLNAILWNIQVKVKDGFYLGYRSLLDDDIETEFYFVPQNDHLLEPFLHFPEIQLLTYINQGFYTVQEIENGIQINDVRFGQPLAWEDQNAPFVFAYKAKIENGSLILKQKPIARPTEDQMPQLFEALWERLKGNNITKQ